MLNRSEQFHKQGTASRLFHYYAQYKLAIAVTVLGLIGFSLIDAGMIYFIKPLIDDGLNKADASLLKMGSLIVVGIFVLRGCANFVSSYTSSWISAHIITSLRQEVFNHLLKLPCAFYDKTSRGQLISKLIYDTEQVAKATSGAFVTLIRESLIILVLITLMFFTSWQLSLIFLIICPIIAGLVYLVAHRFRSKSVALQESMGTITQNIEQSLNNHKEILAFSTQIYELERFNRVNQTTRRRTMKIVLLTSATNPVIQVIASLAMAAVLWLASIEGIIGQISTGAFTATLVAMGSLLKPLKQLSKVNENMQAGFAAAESLFNILNSPPEPDHGQHKKSASKGNIKIRNLTFSYSDSDDCALSNIELDIKAGETIAFVGTSGSGKTTLTDLLLRFYPVPADSIFIDDVPIEDWELNCLRSQFATVSQNINLLDDSLLENIRYGAVDMAMVPENIDAAISDAQLTSVVNKLGTGTKIGENGCLLSGGQRQRVAIARAIYRNAPILILDEATSALDHQSEEKLSAALSKLKGDKTVLIIAHRPATIAQADRIVVLEQGKIIEQGDHKTLLENKNVYYTLHQRQFLKQVS